MDLSPAEQGLWERGDWFLSKENSGGGPLIDLGVHKLDLLLYALDFPEITHVGAQCHYGIGSVIAGKRGKQYDIEDGAEVQLRLASGATIELGASYFRNQAADQSRMYRSLAPRWL